MFKYFLKRTICLSLVLFLVCGGVILAQDAGPVKLWHNKERTLNYHPDGQDIVIQNGKHRFNRAIYGTNTAFRVEAGDLPEFALYLPGMGGNLRFGLISDNNSKWLINAEHIEARYRAGSMLYSIHDSLLGQGTLNLTVLAGAATESLIIKAEFKGVDKQLKLFWAYGGATGKKFSRDGDIGADPESSFYLKPEYCAGNTYQITNTGFSLSFLGKTTSDADRYEIKQPGSTPAEKLTVKKDELTGMFPTGSELHIADAGKQTSPSELWQSKSSATPAIVGEIKPAEQQPLYFLIQSPQEKAVTSYAQLPLLFTAAETSRKKIADRIVVETPDPFINTLGGVLGIAADAIWESPSYMHGAIAWRMRLNAWRGPYIADVLGWHDRARSHFSSYALSQITSPESGPVVADTALHIARQQEKLGNAIFSSGYISRNPGGKIQPHHYDMNLVYIDELLNHFNWTGDLDYVKKMWPVLTRHLAWEKRNFDADGDGLYDAYCAIWASDALQYSGGGVTHSSAYNYKANKMAAQLARLIGQDPQPYEKEADHIIKAMNKKLWMPQNGWYAEYQDLLGNQLLHPSAALWTVYHTIDSEVPDQFQAYQMLRYVDTKIPHIPIIAKGIDTGYYTLPTTNWMPYDWSLNNVVLAECLHTSLAYWQGNRAEEAYKLWKGSLLESMYLENSPGNFDQLSFYDSTRGELYRDFADPIGMAGRSLVEGLFGLHPDALNGKLLIKPGFPAAWDHASLHTPDIQFDFKRKDKVDTYIITPTFSKKLSLVLELQARYAGIKTLTVNGKPVSWVNLNGSVEHPGIRLNCGFSSRYIISVTWDAAKVDNSLPDEAYPTASSAADPKIYDPQGIASLINTDNYANDVHHTLFRKKTQGKLEWWVATDIELKPNIALAALTPQDMNSLKFRLKSNSSNLNGKLIINPGKNQYVTNAQSSAGVLSGEISVPLANLILGSNVVSIKQNNQIYRQTITNWNIQKGEIPKQETINLKPYFNDLVTNVFKNKYLSPRPKSVTLQLPWQGIGNWCYPLIEANIDDTGLRQAAGEKNEFVLPQGIKFATPGTVGQKNILFTSQWDNYPKQATIALSGKATHAYFLMAGSTNPMQSRIINGQVIVRYTDNTTDILDLKNPQTWWPIEQDYEDDGYAFQLNAARPIRVYLKSGVAATSFTNFKPIKGYTNRGIDGGAATVLDLPLNPAKELKSLELKTLVNDVVIGLMSITLIRE